MMTTTLKRGAGILLPVTALPSPYGIGTLGKEAYEFVDFLKDAGQSFWQVLPVGPTSYGDSPYQSFSAFAGNPYMIDLDALIEEGILDRGTANDRFWGNDPGRVAYDVMFQNRFPVLRAAFAGSHLEEDEDYRAFCADQAFWLEDYSLYMACKTHFGNQEWPLWEKDIKFRTPEAVAKYSQLLKEDMEFWKFCQYKFYGQWEKLRRYANERGISLIGDVPIYMALDSADVWVHPDLFQLDENLTPIKVAGVPPDAFSDDGQLWGNPLYDWDAMEAEDFEWWSRRIGASSILYDVVRFDHFIGVTQYYTIPFGSSDGKSGEWKKGPGRKLVDVILKAAGDTKVIAEDLGVSVPEVKQLLAETGLPGMKIIEFAFGGGSDNEHLPHNYASNCVVYGGTHDNETLKGYFLGCSDWERGYACRYMGVANPNDIDAIVSAVFRTAYSSVASVAIFQVQDVLRLDNSARMNHPSTIGGNWSWRLRKGQLGDREKQMLRDLVNLYGR
jgi:4-alpha-glucanotransferase